MRWRSASMLVLGAVACDPFQGATDTETPPTATDGGSAEAGGPSDAGAADAAGRSYADVILGDRPTAYWRFDEPAGATQFVDAVGGRVLAATRDPNASDATLPTTTAAGAVNAGLRCLGSSTWLEGPTTFFDLPERAAFTLELWVLFEAREPNGVFENLVFKGPNDPDGWGLFREKDDPEYLVFSQRETTPNRYVSVKRPSTSWVYLAVTGSKTTTSFYAFGEGGASAVSRPALPAAFTGVTVPGAFRVCDSFVGTIDELALYTRDLTETELRAHVAARR